MTAASRCQRFLVSFNEECASTSLPVVNAGRKMSAVCVAKTQKEKENRHLDT